VGCWHRNVPARGEVAVAPSEQIDCDRGRDHGYDRVHVQSMEQRYPRSRATPPLTLSPWMFGGQLDRGFKRRRRARTGATPRTRGGGGGLAEPGKAQIGWCSVEKAHSIAEGDSIEKSAASTGMARGEFGKAVVACGELRRGCRELRETLLGVVRRPIEASR
jgi:hypothetical protein